MAMAGLLALVGASAQAAEGIRAGVAASYGNFQGKALPDQSLEDKFIDDNSVGFKFYAQYQFNDWFGVEGAYHHTGEFKDESPNEVPPQSLKLSLDGFSIQGLLFAPLSTEDIHVYGKAGYFNFDDELSVATATSSTSAEGGLVLGAGVVLDISDHLGVRAEYEWFDIDVGDLWTMNLGVQYAFGDSKSAK
jgi:uncharacterized protein with beta-barrel porin domain